MIKQVELNTELTPTEFELVIDHLQNQSSLDNKQKHILMGLRLLATDLQGLDKATIIFFLKSEFYKYFLDNQHLPNSSNLDVSSSLLASVESKFKKNKINYSQLSIYIIQNILLDLKPYQADSFINNYKNVNRSNTSDLIRAQELRKKLKYISPWLLAFERLSLDKFNALITDTSIDYINIISKKSYLFNQFRLKNPKRNDTILVNYSKDIYLELITSTTNELSENSAEQLESIDPKNKKKEALEALDQIKALDDNDPSKTIDNLVERLKINNQKKENK